MGQPFETIRFEMPAPNVARIVLARPEVRNAQSRTMTYELNAAFDRAAHDEDVKVIVLAADGPHFSSGHDLSDRRPISDFVPVSTSGGYKRPGMEGTLAAEEEMYLGMCTRWRDIPKPTIAEVQGRVILGGLMLVWTCDLIVASRDAMFSDPGAAFGANGGEYFAHVWELGPRLAKRLLFTGDALTAEDALRIGMVTDVVERADLERFTLELATRVAARPSLGLKLVKQAVNQSVDAQGFRTAVQAAFTLHELSHAHNRLVSGKLVDPDGAAIAREEAREGRTWKGAP